jgi:hypothetical protein
MSTAVGLSNNRGVRSSMLAVVDKYFPPSMTKFF